ncbi:hypothetical protein Tco_1576325 [Tanacetum coccineum]
MEYPPWLYYVHGLVHEPLRVLGHTKQHYLIVRLRQGNLKTGILTQPISQKTVRVLGNAWPEKASPRRVVLVSLPYVLPKGDVLLFGVYNSKYPGGGSPQDEADHPGTEYVVECPRVGVPFKSRLQKETFAFSVDSSFSRGKFCLSSCLLLFLHGSLFVFSSLLGCCVIVYGLGLLSWLLESCVSGSYPRLRSPSLTVTEVLDLVIELAGWSCPREVATDQSMPGEDGRVGVILFVSHSGDCRICSLDGDLWLLMIMALDVDDAFQGRRLALFALLGNELYPLHAFSINVGMSFLCDTECLLSGFMWYGFDLVAVSGLCGGWSVTLTRMSGWGCCFVRFLSWVRTPVTRLRLLEGEVEPGGADEGLHGAKASLDLAPCELELSDVLENFSGEPKLFRKDLEKQLDPRVKVTLTMTIGACLLSRRVEVVAVRVEVA